MDESASKVGKKLKVIKKKKRGMKLERCSAAAAIPKPSDLGISVKRDEPHDLEYKACAKLYMDRHFANKAFEEPNPEAKARDIGRISVTGFEGHEEEEVKSALREHFASCGKITDVYIRAGGSYAFIYFVGEGAVDKALKLDGTDVAGGWKVCAEPYPFFDDNPIIAIIQGYDVTSLSESEMKVAVRDFFSSCGKVTDVVVSKRMGGCSVSIKGIDAAEKVRELKGSYFRGQKVVIGLLTLPPRHTTHNRVRNYGPRNRMTAE